MPAVGGGGRYEDLVSKFSKTKIVGVGASIGVSRLLVALMEAGKIDLTRFSKPVDVAVLVMGDDNLAYAMRVLNTLRGENIPSVAYLDTDKKFKNQIEYADKIGVRFAAIIGETEVANNTIALKNMESGNQESVSIMDAIKIVKAQ